MSAERESAHEFPAVFSLEEMAWMRADGSMDDSLTLLTALEDDVEFERRIFLLRLAHQLADINRTRSLHWQTKFVSKRFQILLTISFVRFLRIFDFLFSGFKNLVKCFDTFCRKLHIKRDR